MYARLSLHPTTVNDDLRDLPEAVVVVGEKSELDVDVGSRKEEGEVAAEEVTDGVEEAGEKFEKVEI